MKRISFGVTTAMIQGGMGTYDDELRGEYPVTWLKREGDAVLEGEVIATLETDKVEIEITAPVTGRIGSVFQGELWSANGEKTETPNGIVIAPAFGEIEEVGSASARVTGETQDVSVRTTPFARKIAAAEGVDLSRIEKGTGAGGRICAEDVKKAKEGISSDAPRAVPAARTYAEAHKIDLSNVKGTGQDGLILLSDVERALWEKHREHLEPVAEMAEKLRVETQVVEPEPYVPRGIPGEDLGKMVGRPEERKALAMSQTPHIRKTIARLLARSWKEIPHAGDMLTIDATVLLEFMRRYNETAAPFSGINLRLDYLVAWYARELLLEDDFCILNGYWDAEKEEITCLPKVNIGIAVDTKRGLIVPVIHDTGNISSFAAFVYEADTMVNKARRGTLGLHDIRGLTFTVNNTGVLGGENPSPIIPYAIAADGTERPTAMILALARIRRDRKRSLLPLVFRFDHRLCDGHEALAFALMLRERIEAKKSPEEFTAELSIVPRSRS